MKKVLLVLLMIIPVWFCFAEDNNLESASFDGDLEEVRALIESKNYNQGHIALL